MTAVFINKPGVTDHTYIGNLYAQSIVVYARTEHQARQRAVEYFKPKKRDVPLINISLHSINIVPITFVEEAGHA